MPDNKKENSGTSGPRETSGSDRVTINDIARMAEVSKKTVSRVLNDHPLVKEETRKRVKAIMKEHGYLPDPQARALAFRRSFLIGLAYDNPSPQYVVNMQRGILDSLEGSDYQLVLQPVDRSEVDYIEKIRRFVDRHRPTGLIMPPSVSEDDAVAEMLREAKCEFVRIGSVELDEPARLVRTHDADGAAQAARHLAGLGHQRIAHIHGPRSFRSAHERLNGFTRGLAEFGIDLSPELTIEAGYTFDSGVRAADNLLSRPDRPTAIFTGNDEMAIGVYTSARNAGLRVPEDLSIVGFDDTPMAARIAPALTTVRLPIREMGQEAAKAVLRLVSEAGNKSNKSFQPEIIVRQSTARPG
ncbi:LacI family DNA-binding transcriptional regulator [Henriciella marina]|uniref:LacI family DNA-binding transcriptional regulator n=1 Tax=Henriciella marina TaxID=453851 RepID=UPI00039C860B|nr:LacI family DNA-binding transcriptional regulator [Henriciella marina]